MGYFILSFNAVSARALWNPDGYLVPSIGKTLQSYIAKHIAADDIIFIGCRSAQKIWGLFKCAELAGSSARFTPIARFRRGVPVETIAAEFPDFSLRREMALNERLADALQNKLKLINYLPQQPAALFASYSRGVCEYRLLVNEPASAVYAESREIGAEDLKRLCRRFADLCSDIVLQNATKKSLTEAGLAASRALLPRRESFLNCISRAQDLIIIPSGGMECMPWQLLALRDAPLGLTHRLSIQCALHAQPFKHVAESINRIVVVCGSSEGLSTADEIRAIESAATNAGMEVLIIGGGRLSENTLHSKLAEGDAVYYCGHARVGGKKPEYKWITSDKKTISVKRLSAANAVPPFIFSHSCFAGNGAVAPTIADTAQTLAENGCRSFLTTLYSIPDSRRADFASDYFASLLAGVSVSEAFHTACGAAHNRADLSWILYRLYGDARLRRRSV